MPILEFNSRGYYAIMTPRYKANMLALLKIRNLALVDELAWEPGRGFLAITGETGAGKSVIMGGISLALGERADKGMIRSGETQCSIEALFQLADSSSIDRLLSEAGVPCCEEGELVIRRVITLSGNRQFINNTPVTLQLLRRLGAQLVDRHHPEAHRSLASPERQLDLLDSYAENAKERAAYDEAYRAWTVARRQLREARKNETTNERELDFLRHQIEEIESAGFTAEETDGLEERWQRARNAGKLRDTALPMLQIIDGDEESLLSRLRQLVRHSRELERLDAATTTWISPLTNIIDELDEILNQLQHYADNLCADPEELAALEERINKLDTLKRKYGSDWESISAHLEACRAKLQAVDHREELLEQLSRQEQQAREKAEQAGARLTAARVAAAPRLESDFLIHASQLGFRQSHFRAQLRAHEGLSPQGAESTEFLFGPNPGEPLKPLRSIASSGELARVMLALKSALAKQDDTPLLIFDEIDANVGGSIARAVGLKMRELGREHQVIAITHFPQVAALADHHYLITKTLNQGRTVSHLKEVSRETRVSELVRMLGSQGAAAEAHARDLLAPHP